jgi:hypothetical protein
VLCTYRTNQTPPPHPPPPIFINIKIKSKKRWKIADQMENSRDNPNFKNIVNINQETGV